MMGRLNRDQGQLFYSFCLDEAVPVDHRAREIAAVLDLSWVHAELAPCYPSIGMIRMLILGYVFAIRSERLLCREVQVNLAYRWFCGLSIENKIPTIRRSRAPGTSGSATSTSSGACSSGWWRPASRRAWSAARALWSTLA
jgi:hypothetical protein